MIFRIKDALEEHMRDLSKEYPIRDGVYAWVDAYSTGMVSSDKIPDMRLDSGSLYMDQKKLIGAGLCLRCEQKKDDGDICKDCRAEMLNH